MIKATTVRKGSRKGEQYAKVRDEVWQRLELLAMERATIYKALLTTGLRRGQLSSLTGGQLHLNGPEPFAELDAGDEKNRGGNVIPLRVDLDGDLRTWLSLKLEAKQREAIRSGVPIPARLHPDELVFDVPDKLGKILTRDRRLAGIPKRDDRGLVLDIHALRHTFGTLLSKGGVAPRTAQGPCGTAKLT